MQSVQLLLLDLCIILRDLVRMLELLNAAPAGVSSEGIIRLSSVKIENHV